MRLFVAFELPDAVRQALVAWSNAQRPLLPPARWIPAQNFHLTLSFLGETDPGCLPMLEEALDTAFADAPPLAMRLAGPGVFPDDRAARVMWVGIDADTDLDCVQNAVVAAVRSTIPNGARDDWPFSPHVTLARCRPAWPASTVRRLDAAAGELPSLPFRVAEGVLFASERNNDGAVYTKVAVFPMRGTT